MDEKQFAAILKALGDIKSEIRGLRDDSRKRMTRNDIKRAQERFDETVARTKAANSPRKGL
jgi:hypothetical protein